MANKTVYTLDLDTSKLISKYKDAISQMEKAGVSSDITKGLSDSLDKLADEYSNLEKAGKAGFTNTRQVDNFNKRVEKLMASFRGLEVDMKGVGERIGKIAKKSDEANKKLAGAFSKLGFKDANKAMQDVLNSTDKEAKVSEILKKEVEERAKAVEQLKIKYEQAAQAAAQASQKANTATLGTNQNSKYNTGESIWTSGKNKVDNSVKQAIVEQAKAITQAAKDGQTAWQQFNDYLKANGLDKAFNQRALPQLQQSIKDMQAGFSTAAPAIEEAARAQEELNIAQQSFSQIGKIAKDGTAIPLAEADKALAREANNAGKAQDQLSTVLNEESANTAGAVNASQQLSNTMRSVSGSAAQEGESVSNLANGLYETIDAAEKTSRSFESLKSRVLMFFSVTSIFNSIRNEIKKTYEDVKQLDKSFASIAMVTKYSVNEMWSSYSQYADMAAQLGQKTNDVIQASALFYQQGLDTNEALALTTDTMKLATLAGNDFQTATQEMTSAIRGFKMEMDEGNRVADVYSNLAAHAAATVDDIAQAMARTASIANSAGMSFENTSAFLTQMIETTQESAENIGTSLKTIIARFTELKENVAGTADSEFEDLDYNKVDKALKSVGVNLKDVNGQFRNLDEVFLELSQKWDSLDRNTQRYVATIAAGSRQQSRFIAMMDNYERTAELMGYAADAEGKADEQFAKYADTMEYKLNQLSTAWEEFRVKIADSDFFKGIIDGLTGVVNFVSNIKIDGWFNKAKLAAIIPLAIWGAKTFALTFISTFQKNFQLAKSIKKDLSTIFLQKKYKVGLQLDPKDVLNVKNQLNKIDKQKKDLSAQKVLLKVDASQLKGTEQDVNQLALAYLSMGEDFGTAETKAKALDAELKRQGMTIQQATEAMKQYKATIVSGGISQAFTSIGSAAASAFSMMLSGMKAADVAKYFMIQTATMAAQYALQAALTKAHEALMNKIKAKGAAQQAATIAAGQAAETGAIVTGGAAQATAAGASGLATGTALSEGFIAGTAGIGAIILAITAAITAVAFLIGGLIKKSKKDEKSLSQIASEAEARAKAAEERANTTKDEANSAQETAKSAKELREEYEKLNKKTIKTVEEQERYKEIVDQIRTELPEVVTSYDAITGQLQVQNDLWDQIIEKYDYIAKQKAVENYGAQFAAIAANHEARQAAYNLKVEERDKKIELLDDISSQITVTEYNNGTYEYKSGSDYLKEQKQSGAYSKEGIADYVELLDVPYTQNLYKEIKQLANEMNISLDEDSEELYKLVDGLSHLGDGFNEAADRYHVESAMFIKNYKQGLDNKLKLEEDYLKQQEEQDKKARITQTKAYLMQAKNYSNASSQFLAEMAESDAYRQSIQDAVKNSYTKAQIMQESDSYGNETATSIDKLLKRADKDWGGSYDNIKTSADLKNSKIYGNISAYDVLNTFGIDWSEWDNEDTWDDDEEWKKILNEKGITTETWNAAVESLINSDFFNQAEHQLDEKQQAAIDNFYAQRESMSEEVLEQAKNNLLSNFTENSEEWKYVNEMIENQVADMQESKKNLQELLGTNYDFKGWSREQLNGFNKTLQDLAEKYNEGVATAFGSEALDLKDNLGLNSEQLNTLLKVNWDDIDLTNIEEVKTKLMESLGLEGEQAEKVWSSFFKLSSKYGLSSLGVSTQETLDSMQETIEKNISKWVDSFSGISGILKNQLEDGFISFTDSQKIKEALKQVGLEAADYLTYNDDGTIILNAEKLTEAYQDQEGIAANLLETARKETQAKMDQIQAQINLLKGVQSQANGEYEITKQLDAQAQILSAMGFIDYNPTEKIAKVTNTTTEAISDLTSAYNKYDNILKNDLNPDSEYYKQILKEVAAGGREISGIYLDSAGGAKDATKAQEDYNKALEDCNKQLEEVTDKQEVLNEKIKEYNELLYGSENRKSSLDYLYNYEEAINSFNDEITRSKDLLSDSKSVEESTTALLRYTQATHNLLAEEKAKQQIYQKGLANYADTIENGGVSYTDRETGNNIDVKFGDYVKKDERTGKYMIDQRLINEAQFADKWKDYLEEQVSNYNKYSEDLLKSEDNVRKAEKELQDERDAARQNYVKMEQEIADALKQQYQDEVDELKSKYDSMKDADDDYLDALQEAIDKQRQLREQDQAWEDLAQKEKKLSLMQRDTSGANALEVQDLEKDVEQTREEMLDNAIDNVIDGLSKLYESQQELRDEEVELKEALLDNTLYWNTQAESLASSFESADEYAAYLSSISKEYADMTLTMQQDKLREYSETYEAATEYMSIIAMDKSSETGDFIVETMTVTGEEVDQIIASTAEVFSDEVIRSYNETTQAFTEDMEKAEKAIDDANKALQEAIQKYNECAAAANAAADAYRQALATQNAFNGGGNEDTEPEPEPEPLSLYGLINSYGVRHEALDDISKKMEGAEADKAMIGQIPTLSSDRVEELADQSGLSKEEVIENWLTYHSNQAAAYASKAGINGYAISDAGKKLSETDFIHWVATQLANKKFADGGLVNFTGPAWVDGSPERPEAFLSAEDTENIGNAARILSNIPWLDRTTDSSTVVTNNGGDVNVEINLNIDHISSETDIDEMLERVKEEIVEVARPAGTNTILQQEL